jgi:hypothetical protein
MVRPEPDGVWRIPRADGQGRRRVLLLLVRSWIEGQCEPAAWPVLTLSLFYLARPRRHASSHCYGIAQTKAL